MVRRDSQHGKAVDDSLAANAKDLRPGGSSRSGHWRDAESPTEDEPGGEASPGRGGTPVGMTGLDVEGRFEVARFLDTGRFPADADEIRRMAADHNAPDSVQGALRRLLPDGRYETVNEVWEAMGGGTEVPRTDM
ncbi:uncharacterized protein DUF2795 [Stackebrandtia albiflava]|uniref:Uncharacterized protein DUF2795 n=1 Tax=Stackebrandtia albiflava TaxID=406432 RepID=A0A562V2Z7_9ACTN|nr:DUF2795 domain-containing protein [Stackebrandtia albiflava]TWJ12192.1 uncharacterized protein DUF2795 [Stackebrandtia albiflava]